VMPSAAWERVGVDCRFPEQGGTAGKGSLLGPQTPGDHTKGWLQAHNGEAVSHRARAAGRQTEPPVSVPVGLGPPAPFLACVPSHLCLWAFVCTPPCPLC
jgi:hypothetical protein